MGKSLTPDQKAETAADELRRLIREAHEAAQALAEAGKQARRQVDEYLEDSLVQQFRNYQTATQELIDKNTTSIEATATAYHEQLRGAFQVVADGHLRVYCALIEHIKAGADKPVETIEHVRARIIKAGDELTAAYHAAGIRAISSPDVGATQPIIDELGAKFDPILRPHTMVMDLRPGQEGMFDAESGKGRAALASTDTRKIVINPRTG
jgi:regulator of sigma D